MVSLTFIKYNINTQVIGPNVKQYANANIHIIINLIITAAKSSL